MGEKLQAPVLNTLPLHPLAAPEGGGEHPQSAHTVPEIKASHCCGMEEPAEQGGSDGYGREGICLAVGAGAGGHRRESQREELGSWQQKKGTERRGKREGEPGIQQSFWDTWQKGLPWGYQGPGVRPVGPRPPPGQDGMAKG